MKRIPFASANGLFGASFNSCARNRRISTWKTFKEGDQILIRPLGLEQRPTLVGKPLQSESAVQTSRGVIPHSTIIGKPNGSIVTSSKGSKFSVHEPTLHEYVVHSPRLATPIYPPDALVLISLLSLSPDDPSIRIFECGTGHGALTLHLAHALYNPSLTNPRIHTLERSEAHHRRAVDVVTNYRNGVFAPAVDFNIGTPREYFGVEGAGRDVEFTHAVLDMPDSQLEMARVAEHLMISGKMVLFVPSVTQLVEAQRLVQKDGIPLYLERVVELGNGISGGREWSLKLVKSRAKMREAEAAILEEEIEVSKVEHEDSSDVEFVLSSSSSQESGGDVEPEFLAVCRPKVGKVISGGGFVGLWRRIESRQQAQNLDSGFTKGKGSARNTVTRNISSDSS